MGLVLGLVYMVGALASVGMLLANLRNERLLVLSPRPAYPLFVAFWPVAWSVGIGVVVAVAVSLLVAELGRRSG